jgi:hypothetical protein
MLCSSNSVFAMLVIVANSGTNGRKRAPLASNSVNRTTKRARTGKYINFVEDFAYLCIATQPPPLVINKDPDHEPPSDSNVDDDDYRPRSKSVSSHMEENGSTLQSEDSAEPEGNTDRDGNDAATAALAGRCTLRHQPAIVSILYLPC